MNDFQQYIHKSRYARWLDSEGRRETWQETVERYIHFWVGRYGRDEIDYDVIKECEEAILNLEVMPSMRLLMTAGPAVEQNHIAAYNCAYHAIDSTRSFDETMTILLNGTGVGFSVERQYINKLPEVPDELQETDTIIRVRDSKAGWANAYRELIALLYSGRIPSWDVSRVRPAGARLKTFGGRASGPGPLEDLFRFTIQTFKGAISRKLNSLEVHDVICKIADIVVVGGVRRSALISLSNLTDERMRHAKTGSWWESNPQRALANNSVCYTERPDTSILLKEWRNLYDSKSGERGIFNRVAAQRSAGKTERRDPNFEFGVNPCSEIILRPKQLCNLTEIVVRDTDTFDRLRSKVRVATILGTLQSTLTNLKGLSKKWTDNTTEERLLGVSLTGIMDHPFLSTDLCGNWLQKLKEVAIETNKEWSEKLGIPQSTAITCVKPSGTVSQLVDSSSGIHPRYSSYYIRTVRTDKKDPIYHFLKDQGVPVEDAINKEESTAIFSFPIKAPEGSVMRDDRTAIEQLELWKIYAENWCEHKPSITVYVREREWLEVLAWVDKNFDICSGISFLPHTDHIYQQAPYQEITKEEYEEATTIMPQISWEVLHEYETEDTTSVQPELACGGGACEI